MYSHTIYDRQLTESSIVRKCLSRNDAVQTNFIYDNNIVITYRRYASLFFIIGCKQIQTDSATGDKQRQSHSQTSTHPTAFVSLQPSVHLNLLSVFELTHMIVETFDKYFSNVCELDIMFNLERAHFMIDEIIMNGCICETNKKYVLRPLKLIDSSAANTV